MCKRSGETRNHLFLRCDVAMDLENFVFQMFRVEWVTPRHNVCNQIGCHKSGFGPAYVLQLKSPFYRI
jgi:hypothetical protein